MKRRDQTGFTIIELMIATVIFAVILLSISAAIVQIGRVYYKGLTQSRTQEVARNVMDSIGQGIQFAGGTVALNLTSVTGSSKGFCVNNQLFSYKTGQQLTGSNHAMVVRTVPSCGGVPADNIDATPTGQELLSKDMRLTKVVVSQPDPANRPFTYQLVVRVVYGDDDLLCSPSVAGDCGSSTTTTHLSNDDLTCKNIRTGTQFCAASELSTIVEKRLD